MSHNITIPKEYRALVREAQGRGWRLVSKRHGHFKLVAPDGYSTPVPCSSGAIGLYKAVRSRVLSHPSFDDSTAARA
jgi:hypothetical protein